MARIHLTWILGFLATAPVHASIEDFESWDIGAEEGDDEYGLDAYFLSFSPEWESEWVFAPEGARSSMGSTVNEVWEMRNEIRLLRDLNPNLRFAYSFVQNEGLTIEDEQHCVGLEIERAGFWFGPFARPSSSKERLDAGLVARRAWSSGGRIDVSYSFEDWNSDHTNGRSTVEGRTVVDFIDPAREWRAGARQVWRGSRWIAVESAWLGEFRRDIEPPAASGKVPLRRVTGGNQVTLRGQIDPAESVVLDFLAERKESRVADFPELLGTTTDLRRDAWKVRARLSHPLPAEFLGRWGVQAREGVERDAAPAPDAYRLELDDIVATAGVRRRVTSALTAEFGYGYQATDVAQSGPESLQRFSWGTRTENRLYLIAELRAAGLAFRFIETIELDDEGYDAVSDHDKGFLQIQAGF
jgi:hypothetical protein